MEIVDMNFTVSDITAFIPKTVADFIIEQVALLDETSTDAVTANKIMVDYSSLYRKLNKTSADRAVLEHFTVLDCCRVFLLLQCKKRCPKSFLATLLLIIKYADDEEKSSIVKGIFFLDDTGDLVNVIIDLCRTNSVDLLIALGLNNPYTSKFFPQLNFNQLVLKLLFCQADISQVKALLERKNSKLSDMANDYKHERINANRSVPLNIELII